MAQGCPPEILAAICKIVANDDALNTLEDNETRFKNLKPFSQTCRAILPHCREHIFHDINIHDSYNPKDRTAERFAQLIEGTPEIADYVRHLRYGMRFHDDLHCGSVVSALDKLTALKSLTLNIQGYARDWQNIPPTTQSSILRLIHLPSLVSLELRSITYLNIGLLPPCPNLRILHLHTITFYDVEKGGENSDREDEDNDNNANPETPMVPVDSIRPQELRLEKTPEDKSDSFSMLFNQRRQDGRPIFDFSGLKNVSFFISNKKDLALTKSILSSAPLLESLEIIGESYWAMKSGAACIQESQAQLSALKSLFFKVYLVTNEQGMPSHPLPGICQALHNIATKDSIEVLKIDVIMYSKFYFTEGNHWGELEGPLIASEWPSLRQVQLNVVSYARGRNALQELETHLDTQFSSLLLQRKFEFDLNVSNAF